MAPQHRLRRLRIGEARQELRGGGGVERAARGEGNLEREIWEGAWSGHRPKQAEEEEGHTFSQVLGALLPVLARDYTCTTTFWWEVTAITYVAVTHPPLRVVLSYFWQCPTHFQYINSN